MEWFKTVPAQLLVIGIVVEDGISFCREEPINGLLIRLDHPNRIISDWPLCVFYLHSVHSFGQLYSLLRGRYLTSSSLICLVSSNEISTLLF